MAFIGIQIPHQVARLLKSIDVPGEKTQDSEYHITIAYFGEDIKINDISKIMETTYNAIKTIKPFSVKINKINCFPEGKFGTPIIAKVKSNDLINLNDSLKKVYDENKIEYSKNYDYNPHITLSYADSKIDDIKIDTIELQVFELVLWAGDHGDDKLTIIFPLETKNANDNLANKIEAFCKLANLY